MYFLKTIDLASCAKDNNLCDCQMFGSTPDQINQVERHRRQNDGVSKSEHLYYIDNGVLLLVFNPDVVECAVLEVLTIETLYFRMHELSTGEQQYSMCWPLISYTHSSNYISMGLTRCLLQCSLCVRDLKRRVWFHLRRQPCRPLFPL